MCLPPDLKEKAGERYSRRRLAFSEHMCGLLRYVAPALDPLSDARAIINHAAQVAQDAAALPWPAVRDANWHDTDLFSNERTRLSWIKGRQMEIKLKAPCPDYNKDQCPHKDTHAEAGHTWNPVCAVCHYASNIESKTHSAVGCWKKPTAKGIVPEKQEGQAVLKAKKLVPGLPCRSYNSGTDRSSSNQNNHQPVSTIIANTPETVLVRPRRPHFVNDSAHVDVLGKHSHMLEADVNIRPNGQSDHTTHRSTAKPPSACIQNGGPHGNGDDNNHIQVLPTHCCKEIATSHQLCPTTKDTCEPVLLCPPTAIRHELSREETASDRDGTSDYDCHSGAHSHVQQQPQVEVSVANGQWNLGNEATTPNRWSTGDHNPHGYLMQGPAGKKKGLTAAEAQDKHGWSTGDPHASKEAPTVNLRASTGDALTPHHQVNVDQVPSDLVTSGLAAVGYPMTRDDPLSRYSSWMDDNQGAESLIVEGQPCNAVTRALNDFKSWPFPTIQLQDNQAQLYDKVRATGKPNCVEARVIIPTDLNLKEWDIRATCHPGDGMVLQSIRYVFFRPVYRAPCV